MEGQSAPGCEHSTFSPSVAYTSTSVCCLSTTAWVRRSNNSTLFSATDKNSRQFVGIFDVPNTHLHTPFPLLLLVDSLRLFSVYLSQTTSTGCVFCNCLTHSIQNNGIYRWRFGCWSNRAHQAFHQSWLSAWCNFALSDRLVDMDGFHAWKSPILTALFWHDIYNMDISSRSPSWSATCNWTRARFFLLPGEKCQFLFWYLGLI